MNSNQFDEAIKSVHDAFTSERGEEPKFKVHERAYSDFLQNGYTAEDLRLVMRYLKSENKRMQNAKYSLRLDGLLDFEYRKFDSFLTEARARERNRIKPPTPKEKVIQQFSPVVGEATATGTALTVKEILRKVVE